jgi:hypothetical protein
LHRSEARRTTVRQRGRDELAVYAAGTGSIVAARVGVECGVVDVGAEDAGTLRAGCEQTFTGPIGHVPDSEEASMKRVIVIGQAGSDGHLSCLAFARMLSARLGVRHMALLADVPPEVDAAVRAHDQWIVTEPAGRFTEALFRRAEHLVWLHFSPADFIRDWLGRAADALRTRAENAAAPAARATWDDVCEAFSHLMMAPQMYQMLRHPALAHLEVHELRNRRQAEFWLMNQRRRSGLRASGQEEQAAGI